MSDSSEQPPVRTWPAGRELEDAECIELSCAACRTPWRIHDRLRGFRMRCSCGVWLAIPIGEQLAIAAANDVIKTDPSDLPISFDAKHARLTAQGLIELPSEPGDVIYQI